MPCPEMNELVWFVAYTRPRCEKKLQQQCERDGLEALLPCYDVAHKYRGKTVVFRKPLFPGYVFLHIRDDQRSKAIHNDYTARLLHVDDQELFIHQLGEILEALDTGYEIRLAPAIGKGTRVKIKQGPLRGVEAWVEDRYGMNTVLLRLDFISQAAAVKLDATDLEPI